jgi:magnesium chelatase family protein
MAGYRKSDVSDFVLVGELSLDGRVRPVRGALPIAVVARANKVKNLIVPEANGRGGCGERH